MRSAAAATAASVTVRGRRLFFPLSYPPPIASAFARTLRSSSSDAAIAKLFLSGRTTDLTGGGRKVPRSLVRVRQQQPVVRHETPTLIPAPPPPTSHRRPSAPFSLVGCCRSPHRSAASCCPFTVDMLNTLFYELTESRLTDFRNFLTLIRSFHDDVKIALELLPSLSTAAKQSSSSSRAKTSPRLIRPKK